MLSDMWYQLTSITPVVNIRNVNKLLGHGLIRYTVPKPIISQRALK